ncbi:MAG: hypothetical protein HY075_11985 [Deltaproteobacteria bacterium]|nr:hypothetical protein [Deltaproteobacteria bacterium]
MLRPTLALALAVACSFLGCGPAKKESAATLATMAPSYATLAESALALLANEIGPFNAPPTPGALGTQACVDTQCAENRHAKKTDACVTHAGLIDGPVFMRAEGVPELSGCATRHGPFHFAAWPPSHGSLLLALGDESLLDEAVPSTAPSRTYDVSRVGHRMARHWGRAAAGFNGTPALAVSFDFWVHHVIKPDPDTEHFRIFALEPLTMTMRSPWDSDPRVFDGAFSLYDRSREATADVRVANVLYRKTKCCHPVAGTLTLSTSSGATYRLDFTDVCGVATLRDELGRPSELKLPGCSY